MTDEEQEIAELIRCECNRVLYSTTMHKGEKVIQIKCSKCKKLHTLKVSFVFK